MCFRPRMETFKLTSTTDVGTAAGAQMRWPRCRRSRVRSLAVDVAALLQLTAWVEKLDAINHMNSGEDQVIINIRSQAVGVLDVWTKRWYVKHAMSDDAQR